MSVKAVGFDLDGTLIDSRLDLANAVNLVRREFSLPPLPLDLVVSYGFIAQDVEQALLQSKEAEQKIGIVHYDEDMETKERTNYSLAYDEIIPLLVKKCQELQREIDILKGE